MLQFYYIFRCFVNIIGSLMYLLKGSTSLQDWAVTPETVQKVKMSNEVSNDGFVEIKL